MSVIVANNIVLFATTTTTSAVAIATSTGITSRGNSCITAQPQRNCFTGRFIDLISVVDVITSSRGKFLVGISHQSLFNNNNIKYKKNIFLNLKIEEEERKKERKNKEQQQDDNVLLPGTV